MKILISVLTAASILFLTACNTTAPLVAGSEGNIIEESKPISLEDFMADALETHSDRIRGLSLAVFTRDDIIFELQYGLADTEASIEVDADTVFHWGSITKLLVYVSAMQLYERGELDFHADIFSYIPAEAFPKIRLPITMHHLIHHTAGIFDRTVPSYLDGTVTIGKAVPTLGDYLSNIFTEIDIQIAIPGMFVEYSNYGIALAGYVVERISGMPFYEYVHRYIFAPLGMTHTALRPDLSDNDWVAARRDVIKGYNRWARLDMARLQYPGYPTGWAVGTISDMIKFARALMPDENGTSLLFQNPDTMQRLFPTHEEIQYGGGYVLLGGVVFADRYGVIVQSNRIYNGFFVFSDKDDSNRVVGHSGQVPGFMSHMLIDIDNGVGLIVVENMQFGLQTIHEFTEGLIEILFRR